MYATIHFLDTPSMFPMIEFLGPKDILRLIKVSKNTGALSIQYEIQQGIFDNIRKVFNYYEKYFDIPFLTKRRTGLHMLRMNFIYQNFYIFTNKMYSITLHINGLNTKCWYRIHYRNIKKIFKYYCSLVNVYYTKGLLYDAMKFNKINLLDLIV